MNRTIKVILAVIFILVIIVSAVSVVEDIFSRVKVDVTEHKLYTLSDGSKSILEKLNQPVKMKLYYTRTAAMTGPDDIRFFNNYYYFVQSLLEEYKNNSNGMVDYEIIDPRPFSDEEAQAIRYGIKRVPMSEDESFMFGLVVQTQFGVNKVIEIFDPSRQGFVEYDISYLIDSAIRREKKTVGVISSLPITGDDVTGYMAQMMMMQGKQPAPAWTIIEQLKQQYDVKKIETTVSDINDVDVLLVVHPKNFQEKTLFAIDQFVLRGGRAIVCVDPHCIMDQPKQQQQMMMQQQMPSQSSSLNMLLEKWGLFMGEGKFAGDRSLAITTSLRQGARPEKLIAYLGLNSSECFDQDNIISSQLNSVRVLFAGVLTEIDSDPNGPALVKTPLLKTTDRGNSWAISSPYELQMMDAGRLMSKFYDGSATVNMAYQVTGRFESAFPDGITIPNADDPNAPPVKVAGLASASEDCAVVIFSDVDFISDMLAYSKTFFGAQPQGDNAAMLVNTIDNLTGSSDLISIRSKGNIRRGFDLVKQIETEAAKQTKDEEDRINAEIQGFQADLQKMVSSSDSQEVIGSEILAKKADVEQKLYDAKVRLREVKNQKREKIEDLKASLRNFNTLPGPVLILLVSIGLGLKRSIKKRHYISHASDA